MLFEGAIFLASIVGLVLFLAWVHKETSHGSK
jgi:hypothetical protein